MNYSIDWDGPGERDDDDRPICFRCDGHGEVPCHCGGDLCFCENQGEKECPACHGEGVVSQEKYDKQIAAHREIMTAMWGEDWDKFSEPQ